MKSGPLSCLPADLPVGLRWVETRGPALRWELRDASSLCLARFSDGPEPVGEVGGMPVRVRLVGRRHPRLRLVSGAGAELAAFSPDWSGLGPLETVDGARYRWATLPSLTGGALLRDEAGAAVVRLLPREDGVHVEHLTTLPDGHAAALVLLSWAAFLRERSGPGRVVRLGAGAAPRDSEEWM